MVHITTSHRGGGEGGQDPYAFLISVMFKKCVQGGAHITNGQPLLLKEICAMQNILDKTELMLSHKNVPNKRNIIDQT